jgi:hypothetical protein
MKESIKKEDATAVFDQDCDDSWAASTSAARRSRMMRRVDVPRGDRMALIEKSH